MPPPYKKQLQFLRPQILAATCPPLWSPSTRKEVARVQAMVETDTYIVSSTVSSSVDFPIGSPSLYSPFSWVPFAITWKEMNAFYGIERRLYTRLVMKLRWDPVRSLQLMAMWVWFDRAGRHGSLVNMMLQLSEPILNVLADEAAMCLAYLRLENYPSEFDDQQQQMTLTQSILGGPAIPLRLFHENRSVINADVSKIFDDVCLKVLRDVMQEAGRLQAPINQPYGGVSHLLNYYVPDSANFHTTNPTPNPNPNPRDSISSSVVPTPFSYFSHQFPVSSGGASSSSVSSNSQLVGEGGYLDPLTRPISHQFEIEDHKQFLIDEASPNNGLHVKLSGRMGADWEVVEPRPSPEVPPDDRTIFLTFSKGYPISKNEVRDFFTRKFGNCFEAIYMQEVSSPREQPLYARLVVKPDWTIDVVLNGKSKVKFAINGKHVWGRKYVQKMQRSPPAAPSAAQSAAIQCPMAGM
ncbi:hypothetical protein SAY86_025188 [Trapa natans]|uniref:Uncharacterized protein n=1 Tax=Trapa natans TaxID=22666 RepID=A0AAN7MWI7_TRANT|nr:hypothetical protein SAY86_025188 [Trapa natans]